MPHRNHILWKSKYRDYGLRFTFLRPARATEVEAAEAESFRHRHHRHRRRCHRQFLRQLDVRLMLSKSSNYFCKEEGGWIVEKGSKRKREFKKRNKKGNKEENYFFSIREIMAPPTNIYWSNLDLICDPFSQARPFPVNSFCNGFAINFDLFPLLPPAQQPRTVDWDWMNSNHSIHCFPIHSKTRK